MQSCCASFNPHFPSPDMTTMASPRPGTTCEPLPPSEWVHRFTPLIAPGGRVVDVACGRGRHSLHLRDGGLHVVAVDRDPCALAFLRDQDGIETVAADLESEPWPFLPDAFDAVVVCNYLWRPLLPHLVTALRDGGVLIYETFALGNEEFGRPTNPEFLLRHDELLQWLMACGDMRVRRHCGIHCCIINDSMFRTT